MFGQYYVMLKQYYFMFGQYDFIVGQYEIRATTMRSSSTTTTITTTNITSGGDAWYCLFTQSRNAVTQYPSRCQRWQPGTACNAGSRH